MCVCVERGRGGRGGDSVVEASSRRQRFRQGEQSVTGCGVCVRQFFFGSCRQLLTSKLLGCSIVRCQTSSHNPSLKSPTNITQCRAPTHHLSCHNCSTPLLCQQLKEGPVLGGPGGELVRLGQGWKLDQRRGQRRVRTTIRALCVTIADCDADSNASLEAGSIGEDGLGEVGERLHQFAADADLLAKHAEVEPAVVIIATGAAAVGCSKVTERAKSWGTLSVCR